MIFTKDRIEIAERQLLDELRKEKPDMDVVHYWRGYRDGISAALDEDIMFADCPHLAEGFNDALEKDCCWRCRHYRDAEKMCGRCNLTNRVRMPVHTCNYFCSIDSGDAK